MGYSFVKVSNYYDYEVNRSVGVSADRAQQIYEWMQANWDGFEVPGGYESIKKYGGGGN